MRRRPSWLLGLATRCDKPPAVDKDSVAYARGKIDGRDEEAAYWEDQLRRTAELVRFMEEFPDPEFE